MNPIQINCKNCGAPLKIDLDRISKFCPYCGAEMLLNVNDLDAILLAKEKTKQMKEKTKQMKERSKQEKQKTIQDVANASRDYAHAASQLFVYYYLFGAICILAILVFLFFSD